MTRWRVILAATLLRLKKILSWPMARLPARLSVISIMGSRSYVFTLNNYTVEEEKAVLLSVQAGNVKYCCFGKEVGANGTPHLQGVVLLHKTMRTGAVKRFDGFTRVHLEPRRGTWDQAIEYCKKDGDWKEVGARPRQGRRSDLEDVVDMVGTKSLREIADEAPVVYVKYFKGIQELKKFKYTERSWEMEVIVAYGPPGTGKTRMAVETSESHFMVATPRSGSEVWFDGYEGQETMILDDFYGWLRWSFLLKLLDRYKLNLPVKGGFVPMRSKRIVITSNTAPNLWYKYDDKKLYSALTRRISRCFLMEMDGYSEITFPEASCFQGDHASPEW